VKCLGALRCYEETVALSSVVSLIYAWTKKEYEDIKL